MKGWSGSPAPSERLVTSRFAHPGHLLNPIVFCKLPSKQSNVHITNLSSISVIGAQSHESFFCLQRFTSMRGVGVALVR
jgi:hypothetical protein